MNIREVGDFFLNGELPKMTWSGET